MEDAKIIPISGLKVGKGCVVDSASVPGEYLSKNCEIFFFISFYSCFFLLQNSEANLLYTPVDSHCGK
jgi:hypothetical protein